MGYRKQTARFKRLKNRQIRAVDVIRELKEARQLHHFLAYAQEVGLEGIKRLCGTDVWPAQKVDTAFAIGRDGVAFAYLKMPEEKSRGAIDQTSKLVFRIEVNLYNDEGQEVGFDFFVLRIRLSETGELMISARWLFEEEDHQWPTSQGIMSEVYERVLGALEVLRTLRTPLSTQVA